ncbi:MAG: zinc-ribbon domain-containing protein [Stellaceae bacterium]
MIVICPVCSARYLTDPRALGAIGRRVRCTRCHHIWAQAPAEDAPHRVDLVRPRAARRGLWPSRVLPRGFRPSGEAVAPPRHPDIEF